MKAIISSVYAGSIQYYSVIKNSESAIVDVFEHYEKQSYRNRTEIHGANGQLDLIIPLLRRGNRMPMNDVRIEYSHKWLNLHWRSLESAYRSSPYFEFYEHEFKAFYKEEKHDLLIDFNRDFHNTIIRLLGIENTTTESDCYTEVGDGLTDFRKVIHPKNNALNTENPKEKYIQVFGDRNGFIPNLSILDLLFNEGPNAVSFL